MNYICDCGQRYTQLAAVMRCQAANHSAAAGCELADAERAMRDIGIDPNSTLDNCSRCRGKRGGIPGNENVLEDGTVLCDYCHADDLQPPPTKQITLQDTTMAIYSFRAECQPDVERLLQALRSAGISSSITSRQDIPFPDVDIELETDATLDILFKIMSGLDDAHTMLQSLRACPLAGNSLERTVHATALSNTL